METQQQPPNPFAESGLFQSTTDVWTPFKLSLEGWAGGGKTLTECLILLGIWIEEQKQKIVALQDTDHSAKFIVPLFKHYGLIEGKNFFVTPSRSLLDFRNILALCNKEHAIFMIDTVTHIHAELLKEFSEEKKRPVQYPGDAMVLKPEWTKQFTTPFVEAQNCHILFTGRAAWEYGMFINEETNKKEFGPTGVKMRGDNELAYEPDVVILMERLQDISSKGVITYRRASILKDRSRLIDGKYFDFWPQGDDENPNKVWDYEPVWKVFRPIYKFLTAGNPVDQKIIPQQTPMGQLFAKGNAEAYYERRRQVDALMEEIDGVYAQWIPGSGGKEKQLRSIIWNLVFNTRSKSVLAERTPDELKRGLAQVETLSIYVAKNLDLLEKMHDKGEYENIQDFISQELARLNNPAPVKVDDDYIPDWEQKPLTELLSVKGIIEAYGAVKTVDEIECIDKQVQPFLENLDEADRESIVMAGDLARSILLAQFQEPTNGGKKPTGKSNRGKRTPRPSA